VTALRIVFLSILAAVLYGIVHDQITVRICVEYFTIGHPPVFRTDDQTTLAFGWGVIATWWAGALIAIVLAIAARAGSRPKLPARAFVRPVGALLLGMALVATIAGWTGGLLAQRGAVFLVGELADRIPKPRHGPFLVCLWSHVASYGAGFLGGLVLAVLVRRRRVRLAASGARTPA
jgi:hypothetical protein